MHNKENDLELTLTEQHDEYEDRKVKIKLKESAGTAVGYVEGYETVYGEVPADLLYLEIWKGELRLLVWADKDQEDPTHTISLEKARK